MASLKLAQMKANNTIFCYADSIYRMNGIWESPNPLAPIIPVFVVDMAVAVFATRLMVLALRPFKQPPFVAELLSGVLLGPSALGRWDAFRKTAFPVFNFLELEPMAHFALVLYAFLMGLEADVKAISRTGTKALTVAIAGAIIPFVIGSSLYFIFQTTDKMGFFIWGSALAVTGFSVLTRTLENQKIIHSEIGKLAMSSALVSEVGSWVLLSLAFALTNNKYTTHWTVICTTAFVLLSVYYLRPALDWIIRHAPEGQGYSEYYLCFVLCGAFLFGIFTDACGTHPMIGAFVFGLIVPNEVLAATLIDRLEDFVLGLFMPIFFAVCGLRTNIDVLTEDKTSWAVVAGVMILLCSAKVLSSIAVSFFRNIPLREATAVGVLSNTKGILVMVILEAGQEHGALNTQTYSIMVVAVLLMTMMVTPFTIINRPSKNSTPYKRKTIQKSRSDEELRVVACIHGMRNVTPIINLLEASSANQRSPLSVFALQLVELIGRASATLVVHNSRKAGPRNPTHSEAQTEQIISAFDNYELRYNNVTIQALTARSAYSTMDEDICSIAQDKRATFLILPFHKQLTVDGEMEDVNPAIRSVNESVLANAPCSVGILINRGFSKPAGIARRVAMLYFGGADDREALAYAWRMIDHPDVTLKVIRFVPGKDAIQLESIEFLSKSHAAIAINIDTEREKLLDEDFLNKFKAATADNDSISYSETVLSDEEETIGTIKAMDEDRYELYIVGKGRGYLSPLTAGLVDWCDCPELGAIGDLLVTSEFASSFAVLVVQQYCKRSGSREGSVRSSNNGDEFTQLKGDADDDDGFREREHSQ